MGEKVTSHFPAMGEGPFTDVHDPSADRSPYTKLRAKGGGKSDGPDLVKGGERSRSPVNAEVLGPLCRPNTTIAYSSDPTNLRNVRIIPSRAGVSDMWARREEGPVIG
jgi:hypothetical protein